MRLSLPGMILALLVLSSCSSDMPSDHICPKTGFIDKADTVAYAGGGDEILARGVIRSFTGECKLKNKKGDVIEVALTVPFAAVRGEAGTNLKMMELPYFIAVLSPEEEILQRKAFTTKITFNNEGAGTSEEKHVLSIPLASRADARKYKMVIGFALTPDQYKHNEEPRK
jgi:hypothetical protein